MAQFKPIPGFFHGVLWFVPILERAAASAPAIARLLYDASRVVGGKLDHPRLRDRAAAIAATAYALAVRVIEDRQIDAGAVLAAQAEIADRAAAAGDEIIAALAGGYHLLVRVVEGREIETAAGVTLAAPSTPTAAGKGKK